MSIVAFKRKSAIQYGSNRSGVAPGGVWMSRGPFGHTASATDMNNESAVGFSINGGRRNVGYIGKDSKMSKSGTPFRGNYPVGWGGTYGQYPTANPVMNVQEVDTLGTQYKYIKPSVLSTRGMLRTRFKWIYNGKYPNYWVQPNNTGNLVDNASQSVYIQQKSANSVIDLKVNSPNIYEGYIVNHGPTLCKTTTAKFKFNDMARNGPYVKELYNPVSYDQYNKFVERRCMNPIGPQKPFPYAVTTGTGIQAAGTSITNFGSSCGIAPPVLSPPDWYTGTGPPIAPN